MSDLFHLGCGYPPSEGNSFGNMAYSDSELSVNKKRRKESQGVRPHSFILIL